MRWWQALQQTSSHCENWPGKIAMDDCPKINHCQGCVSLTFRELSKTSSGNLCIAEIVLLMRISSWNIVLVSKAMFWAHMQSSSLKISPSMWLMALYIFARLFWRARKKLVKRPPGHKASSVNPRLTAQWVRPLNICHFQLKNNILWFLKIHSVYMYLFNLIAKDIQALLSNR